MVDVWGDKPLGGTNVYITGYLGNQNYPKTTSGKLSPAQKKEQERLKRAEENKKRQEELKTKLKTNPPTTRAEAVQATTGVTPATTTTGSARAAEYYENKNNTAQAAKEQSTALRTTYYPTQTENYLTSPQWLLSPPNWGQELEVVGEGFLTWNKNLGDPTPLVIWGDKSGNAIPSQFTDKEGIQVGSPLSASEAKQKVLNEYAKQENGYLKLKEDLVRLNYLDKSSLANGNNIDTGLLKAIEDSVFNMSLDNYSLAKTQGKKAMFLSYESWLKQTKPKVNTSAYGPSGSGAGGTRVVHRTFDAADYDIAIDQLFQQTIGRGASKEELDFFVNNLKNYEAGNPQTTVTKVSGDTTTSTTSGGLSPERAASMMREQALASPGAEEYNKATKYLDYLMEAISSPIQLGK